MPASRPSPTELRRAPVPIRSRHWPIPPGAKAGKRRAIGPGPKQLVGPAQIPAPARPYRRSPVIAMSICRLPQLEQTSLSRANRTLRLQPLRTPDALHRTDARAAAEVIVSRLKEQVSAAGVGAANSSSVSLQPSMLELSGRAPRHHRPRSVKDHLLYANIDTHHSAQIAVLFTASVTEK